MRPPLKPQTIVTPRFSVLLSSAHHTFDLREEEAVKNRPRKREHLFSGINTIITIIIESNLAQKPRAYVFHIMCITYLNSSKCLLRYLYFMGYKTIITNSKLVISFQIIKSQWEKICSFQLFQPVFETTWKSLQQSLQHNCFGKLQENYHSFSLLFVLLKES